MTPWRLREITEKLERMPLDLLTTALIALATLAFTLTPLSDLPVRIPLGLLMVLFVPGYALIAALFPRKGDLDGIERVALSFGLSIAVVPLIGLGLNYTPWGIRLTPVVISLAIFTVIMAAAAYLRRMRLPAEDRFSLEFIKHLNALKAELVAADKSRLDRALTVLLVISIILSVSALVYVIVTPKQGEKFTEFYILGKNGMAYDYPTSVMAGNNSTVIVGVVNHEYSLVNYTMHISLNNSTILGKEVSLEHNQTWEEPVIYTLSKPGDSQKLEFLLYKEKNFTAPYRDLHLWVNVSENTSLKANTINLHDGQRSSGENRKKSRSSSGTTLKKESQPYTGIGNAEKSTSIQEIAKDGLPSAPSDQVEATPPAEANLAESGEKGVGVDYEAAAGVKETDQRSSSGLEIAETADDQTTAESNTQQEKSPQSSSEKIAPMRLGSQTSRKTVVLGRGAST